MVKLGDFTRGVWRALLALFSVAESAPAQSEPVQPTRDKEFEYRVIERLLESEISRIDKVDTKIGTVVVAQIAVIGYLFDRACSFWDHVVALSIVIPLGIAAAAFNVYKYKDAPDPEKFYDAYRYHPEEVRDNTIKAMIEAFNINHERIDKKAQRLRVAFTTSIVLAVLIFTWFLIEKQKGFFGCH